MCCRRGRRAPLGGCAKRRRLGFGRAPPRPCWAPPLPLGRAAACPKGRHLFLPWKPAVAGPKRRRLQIRARTPFAAAEGRCDGAPVCCRSWHCTAPVEEGRAPRTPRVPLLPPLSMSALRRGPGLSLFFLSSSSTTAPTTTPGNGASAFLLSGKQRV